jgi:hypothetical protein
MAKTPIPTLGRGPTISALDPWAPSAGRVRQLLTDDERARTNAKLHAVAPPSSFRHANPANRRHCLGTRVRDIVEMRNVNSGSVKYEWRLSEPETVLLRILNKAHVCLCLSELA